MKPKSTICAKNWKQSWIDRIFADIWYYLMIFAAADPDIPFAYETTRKVDGLVPICDEEFFINYPSSHNEDAAFVSAASRECLRIVLRFKCLWYRDRIVFKFEDPERRSDQWTVRARAYWTPVDHAPPATA